MNDHELSTLLQEWPPTAAPVTLEERVFGPRPLPVPWYDALAEMRGRIPAGPLAALGTAVGALLVSLLFMLVQSGPAVPPPAPPAKQVAAPEPPAPRPVSVPKTTPKPHSATKPRPVPPPPVVSNLVSSPPTVLYNPMPSYVPDATGSTVTVGGVGLRVHIDKEGRVTGAEFLEGNEQLADIAIEAVKQWRYRPELVDGEPVESSTIVSVSFGPRPRPAKGKAR